MFDHVRRGAVRERLTRLSSVIGDVLVDVIDIPRWRKRVSVFPIDFRGGLGDLSIRRHAIFALLPSMLDFHWLAVFVLQGAVTAARVVRRAGLFRGAVIPVRILQGGVSRRGMAARVAAVATGLLNVHLLAPVCPVVL